MFLSKAFAEFVFELHAHITIPDSILRRAYTESKKGITTGILRKRDP